MNFTQYLTKFLWGLGSIGLVAVVGILWRINTVSTTNLETARANTKAQERVVLMQDALELRVRANELNIAVGKALESERHK